MSGPTQASQNTLTEKEQAEHALATVELLYKLNTIAIKVRKSGLGFLAGQKPALDGKNPNGAAVLSNKPEDPKEFAAVYKVDFPTAEIPTANGETQGTFAWLTHRRYPMRGFAIAETVHALTMFKKMFRLTLEGLAKHKVKVVLMAVLFPKPFMALGSALVQGFAQGMEKHLFKDERYCQPVREIRRVLMKQLREDGYMTYEEMPKPTTGDEKRANIARFESFRTRISVLESVSALLEFDDAYRYRFQWLFKYNGQAKEIAKSPVKELRKMFGIMLERESDPRLKTQWKVFRQAVWLLAINWRLRKEVQRFFNELNDEEMMLSVEDKFHAVMKSSFDFGLPPQESYH
jgi:hypothetical protein